MNKVYYYKVKVYKTGKSKTYYSSASKKAYNRVRPGAASVKSIRAGKHTIVLRWSKINKARGYIVYRSKAGGKYKQIKVTSGTKFVNKKLSRRTKYRYVVRAYSNVGKTKCYAYVGKGKTIRTK